MSEAIALEGGCLCGAVRYRYTGELGGGHGAVTMCHCRQCRKAQGAAAAVAPAATANLVVTDGADMVREYESSPGKYRAFCARCGSPLYSRRFEAPDALRLRLGSLDETPAGLRIDAHIFFEDRAAWEDTQINAPKYPAQEPDR